jgi:hypothetical protein
MCISNSMVKLIKGLKFKFGIQNKKRHNRRKKIYKRKEIPLLGPKPPIRPTISFDPRSPPLTRGADAWASLVCGATIPPSRLAARWGSVTRRSPPLAVRVAGSMARGPGGSEQSPPQESRGVNRSRRHDLRNARRISPTLPVATAIACPYNQLDSSTLA